MTGHARNTPIHRLEGPTTGRGANSVRRISPTGSSGFVGHPPTAGDGHASRVPAAWAHEPGRIPWLEGAEYEYRLGSHRLVLATRGVTRRLEAAVGRAEAEFALVVAGPLLVLGYRFGDAMPRSWSAPYNWHFTPPAERVVPAAVPLTPETYARLWATLWITLVDADDGRVRVRRAVALRPEFTDALHGVLRAQALEPFRGAVAGRALDRLRYAATPLALRACAWTACAAVPEQGSRWAPTRAGRGDPARGISMRQRDGTRPRHLDRRHRRVLEAHPPYSGPSPTLPRASGRRRLALGRGGPPGEATGPCPRFHPRPRGA